MEENDRTVFVNMEKKETEGKINSELEQIYMELGKQYYEGGFEDPLPELLPLFDKITRLRKQYEKGPEMCPNCGVKLGENAKFCGQCGYKIR